MRYKDRVLDTTLKNADVSNLKIGVLKEFDIEELDGRNRKIQ
jgi:hypothetical protein